MKDRWILKSEVCIPWRSSKTCKNLWSWVDKYLGDPIFAERPNDHESERKEELMKY